MNIRFEFAEDADEEIVIRCRAPSEQCRRIMHAIETVLTPQSSILLNRDNTESLVSHSDILYFETGDNRVYAHTKHDIYAAPHTLTALEHLLPATFVRVSKSCIVNVMHIERLRRELVGNGEIGFTGCEKSTYFSRSYYKGLYEKIEKMRLYKNEKHEI